MTRQTITIAESGTHYIDACEACLLIHVVPGVQVTLIEPVFTQHKIDIQLAVAADAKVTYIVEREQNNVRRMARVYAKATLEWLQVVIGEQSVSAIDVQLMEGGAKTNIKSVMVGKQAATLTARHTVSHEASETVSNIETRCLADGTSENSIISAIQIPRGNKACIAAQQAKNLMLSEKATIYCVPELHIHEQEVTCSHAVGTTFIEDELLFYTESRGMTRDDAIRMIAEGHIMSLLTTMPERAKADILATI